ncbi:MAG: hypothetical protein AB1757_06580 [Acidobacteriota bacterium]
MPEKLKRMMNYLKELTFPVGLSLSVSMFLAICAFGQTLSRDHLSITDQTTITQPVSDDVSLITIAYGKLAKYIKAAYIWQSNGERPLNRQGRSEKLADNGSSISFEIKNIRTGAIEDIYQDIYGERVSKPQGDILNVGQMTVRLNNGSERIAYKAEWGINQSNSLVEDWQHTTFEEVLRRVGTTLPPVKKYTAYDVKVKFGKKEKSYKAMILHHEMTSSSTLQFSFLDNIVGQIALTKAFYETRPAIE